MRRLKAIEKCVEWEEPLHDIAREQTGLDDFGDVAYLEGLRILLEGYDIGCDLSPIGWIGAKQKLVNVLRQRLLAEQVWKERPELLARPIERPVVITGLVRTGSTALHYLMARDPERQALPYWLAEHPQPRPREADWAEHPDFLASKGFLDLMFQAAPELKAVHFMAADWPEECGHLMAQTFTDDYWECGMHAPHYVEWYERANLVPTYARHKKLLQTIGSPQPEKPWLLKYPVHMKHLASFLEVYPDALVIWTHRDPAVVMSSYTSLIAGFRSLNVNHVDRDAIAREQMEIWAAGAERAMAVREGRDPRQFYDLYFDDFVCDPVGSVERIYRHFELPFGAACRSALEAWQAENPQEKHGKHRHSSGVLSTARDEITGRFAAYLERFGLS